MPELPTTFGKYFLTEKLATGGMAEIYLAKIVGPGGFEKQLVIKQIHPKLSGQRHFVDLFVAEAKTLVSLTHGNIVPVYELGVLDDTYFIAMEYIDGPTLYRLTESIARRDTRMEPAVAAWITARIVEGLDYAHRKGDGVIHRDLSPRNVMLSRDGEVKLVDFGIAVTLGDANDDESAQSAPTGSFPYMSPEQVRKEQLTNQTDLFSVGVLFWEMLVGHRLFARADPDATLLAVTEGDIAKPSVERPEIPPKLDEIVLRALERDKTVRWTDASEMLGALNKYLYALDDTPGPRDVAALVARYCPPETRRLPTHADPLVLDELVPGVDSTKPRADDTQATPPPASPGPHTAVIPRDKPRKRPGTTRNQSFATHVQLKDILERGTPLYPFDAIDDKDGQAAPSDANVPASVADADSGPATSAVDPSAGDRGAGDRGTNGQRAGTNGSRQPRAARSDDSLARVRGDERDEVRGRDSGRGGSDRRDSDERGSDGSTPDSTLKIRDKIADGELPPRSPWLVAAGLGGFVLLAIAIWMFMRNREEVLNPVDAGIDAVPFYLKQDAPEGAQDASAVALGDAAIATSTDDAGVVSATDASDAAAATDAAAPDDARVATRDAGDLTRIDAGAVARDANLTTVDAPTRPSGTATLVIGADPWCEVFVDGEKKGRTPGTFKVSAGKHTIECVFSPPDADPKKQTWKVDLAGDATAEEFFDFIK
ncbi:MAG: serine/threonine protein kinase [Kofleriaceae bacterium]